MMRKVAVVLILLAVLLAGCSHSLRAWTNPDAAGYQEMADRYELESNLTLAALIWVPIGICGLLIMAVTPRRGK